MKEKKKLLRVMLPRDQFPITDVLEYIINIQIKYLCRSMSTHEKTEDTRQTRNEGVVALTSN